MPFRSSHSLPSRAARPRFHRGAFSFLILLFFGMLTPLSAQSGNAWTFVRGDANHDEVIDISDAIQLLGQLFSGVAIGPCPAAGDANGDASRDIGDAIFILAYLFSAGDPPSAPFPACGTDASVNALTCDGPLPTCGPATPPAAPPSFEAPRPSPAAPNLAGVVPVDRPGEGSNTPMHGVHLHNGELHLEWTDLAIAGRGLDFRLVRTYRSKNANRGLGGGTGSGMGHCYLVSATENPDGSIEVDDGTGRRQIYTSDATGIYTTPGYFETGDIPTQDQFRITFASGGTWNFLPFDSSATSGKLGTIQDRHGNTLTCVYAPTGELSEVIDTLGRPITFAYDASGQLSSVTDFTGRAVTYDYYQAGETGGSPGDLKSVTSPVVVGTPHGNDFPNGKTTTFTYSTGFADEALNHNLLTVTDPKGQTVLTTEYATTPDPTDPAFDTVVRQNWGGGIIDLVRVPETPTPANGEAVIRCITNDRRGIVTEFFYDADNRCVERHLYTGFALPDLPTDLTTNRPTGKLRQADPDRFETRWTYDANSVLTSIEWPRGNRTEFTIDATNPDRRMQGNVLEERRVAGTINPPGDQDVLIQSWTFLPGFGGALQREFASSYTAPDGTVTTRVLDADTGNLLEIQHPLAGAVENFEYNGFGQLTARVHAPSDFDPVAPHRRRDEFTYSQVNGQPAYLASEIIDATGLALTTTFIHDERGNVTQTIDPSGNANQSIYNALDQVVIELSREISPGNGERYENRFFYDANDNRVRIDVENSNEQGVPDPANPVLTTIFEFDLLNGVTGVCRETGVFDVPSSPPQLTCGGLPASEFTTTEFEYDGNRNLVLARKGEATNGNQPENVESYVYDERDLLYREVRGTAPETSTTQFDYDPNGNVGRIRTGLEAGPRATFSTHDAFERLVTNTDPMGNVTTYHYDENSNVVNARVDGEAVDVPGSTGNVRLSEFTRVYDTLDRCIALTQDHFDAQGNPIGDGARTTLFDYFPCGLPASETDDKGATHTFIYDSAHRPISTIDPLGNRATTLYDANSNVVRVERFELPTIPNSPPPPVYGVDFTYDGLDRRVTETDPIGRTYTRLYDSRDLEIGSVDARGNESLRTFDAAGRVIEETQVLHDGGVGTGAVNGQVTMTFTYDDSDRLVAQTDGNGSATTYAYDALDRCITTVRPDGTQEACTFDAHDDLIGKTDANGTSTTTIYDALGRPIDQSYLPGPGVAPTTTFETYAYDGLSRVVRAEDDDNVNLFTYDSLSNPITETLDGVTTSTAFDAIGNLTSLTYPGGRQVQYFHDPLDRCEAIQVDPTGLAIAFDYVGPGRLTQRVDPTGTACVVTYDAAHRIVEVRHEQGATGQVAAQVVLGWNEDDNKTLRDDQSPATGRTLTCQYDSLGRLSEFTTLQSGQVLASQLYTYDGAGNRQQLFGTPLQGNYFLDPSSPAPADLQMNQYTDTPRGARNYDERGNRVEDVLQGLAPRVYSYDVHDRLVAIDDPFVGLTELDHDASGQWVRTRRSAPGQPLVEVAHFYSGGTLIEDRDGAGATLATYLHGGPLGGLLSLQRDVGLGFPEDFYFRSDDLGSVVALTNSAGDVVERYSYSETGAPTVHDGGGNVLPASQVENPFTFAGMRTLPELGVLNGGTRFYDPTDGRYLSHDPAGAFADARNLGAGQSYMGNDFISAVEHPAASSGRNGPSGLSKADSKRGLVDLFNSAASQSQRCEDGACAASASESISKRAARTGRNPQTGKEIKIAAKNGSAPRDAASGMASGKRQHKPVSLGDDPPPPDVFFDIIDAAAGSGGNGGSCTLTVHVCHLLSGGGGGGGGTSYDGGGGGGGRGADHGSGRATGHRIWRPSRLAPSSDHEPFVFYDIILMVAGGGGGNGELCGETIHLIAGGGGSGNTSYGSGGSGGRIHVTGGSSQATGHRGPRSRLASSDHEPFVFYDIILMVAGGGHGGAGSGGSIFMSKKGYDAYMAKSDTSASQARGKKGYDAYQARGDRGSRAASKDKVKFKAGADLSKKVN